MGGCVGKGTRSRALFPGVVTVWYCVLHEQEEKRPRSQLQYLVQHFTNRLSPRKYSRNGQLSSWGNLFEHDYYYN